MRYLRKIFALFFTFSIFVASANAASKCDSSKKAELNREVANIKASYEILEKTPDGQFGTPDWWTPEMGLDVLPKFEYFKINIVNLSENFYALITNNSNSEEKTLTYNDSVDGVASFEWNDKSKVVKFTIRIYTTEATGCAGEEFRTLNVTIPRYNEYSQYALCNQLPEYYLCQKYVTLEKEVDYETFIKNTREEINKKVEEEQNELITNPSNWWDSITGFIKDHLVLIIGGGILVIGGVTLTTVLIIKKRRREDL